MSSFWFNVAFRSFHLQAEYGLLRFRLTRNKHFDGSFWFRVFELEWPWPSTPEGEDE